MNAARRNRRRLDWPARLYEPRPGYYVWRNPITGETLPIGRVSLSEAKSQAIAANFHVDSQKPTLLERLTGEANTFAQLLAKMPPAKAYNTAKSIRSLDKRLQAHFLGPVAQITVRDCAELLEAERDAGRARSAQALRSRMVAVFRRGQELGWMDSNPAAVTRNETVKTKRGRLTLETFRAIYAKADEVAPWLAHAMRLAVLTGADVSTLSSLTRAMSDGETLTFTRSKTNARIAVPLRIRLEALGWTLADQMVSTSGILSPWLIHHRASVGKSRIGGQVSAQRLSKSFTEARRLAGIAEEGAPTMHECRSLAKRLYEAQGNVDTKALLGHATERMGEMYADPRGAEAVRVRVDRQVNAK